MTKIDFQEKNKENKGNFFLPNKEKHRLHRINGSSTALKRTGHFVWDQGPQRESVKKMVRSERPEGHAV